MQGSAATHLFLLEQLLQRCVAQAAAQRLPVFFTNATLALAELASQHQTQPAGAPTTASVTVLRTAGEPRLAYSASEGKGEKRADGSSVQVQPAVVTGVSPAAVVRPSRIPFSRAAALFNIAVVSVRCCLAGCMCTSECEDGRSVVGTNPCICGVSWPEKVLGSLGLTACVATVRCDRAGVGVQHVPGGDGARMPAGRHAPGHRKGGAGD